MGRTPPEQLKTRPAKGGGSWTYVNGAYCVKMLNLVFGMNWSFKVVKHEFDINVGQCFVLGELTCVLKGQTITKQQFGRQEIKFLTEPKFDDQGNPVMNRWGKQERIKTNQPMDIGNDLKGATTDALKKCATLFGFFSDVYYADDFKDINIVDQKTKEQTKADQRLERLNKYLLECVDLDEVETLQQSFETSVNGTMTEDEETLINTFKNKFKNRKNAKTN